MYRRTIENELLSLARDYPVVTLTGPRQSGKTTVVRQTFRDKPYANLEAVDIRAFAKRDPRAFLKQFPNGAVLDEIQRCPDLLSYIQLIVDENDDKGLFILTGSHQTALRKVITQSLAGRTALLTLLPLSLEEMQESKLSLSLDTLLLRGGYPRIHKDQLDPTKAHRNYFQTYVERDLSQLMRVKDLSQFQNFVRLCAARVGQLVNCASLSSEVGVSAHTIREWISILEASYLLFKVPPYFENFNKRIVKTSKYYFADTGLLCYLLGIQNELQLARDPLRGALFENFVVLEMLKFRYNRGVDPELYFFRDTHGHEVDLIFRAGHQLIPIAIKSAETFNTSFLKNISYFSKLAQERVQHSYVLFAGDEEQKGETFSLLNYAHTGELMRSLVAE